MTDEDRAALREDVKQAEGWRANAYQDSVGVWTIGYGTNLQALKIDATLGERWLLTGLQSAEGECRKSFPWFEALSAGRQRVLVEMVYNLGMPRLRGFGQMLAALKAGEFERAADEMLSSRWADQVGGRALRLVAAMRKG